MPASARDTDLGGVWRAAIADDELRRAYPEPDFDDRSWGTVAVPGHWCAAPGFEDADGPVLYRHRFESVQPMDGERKWLVFDGLLYQADVWLDGAYVGDAEGYFFAHRFEVTEALADRREHVLAVEVACGRAADPASRRNVTGLLQPVGGGPNPGGIWRPARVATTGVVAIGAMRVLCTDATEEAATVTLRATFDAASATTAQVRTRIGEVERVDEHALAAGRNERTWAVTIDRPALWWPHALGDAPLHEVSVTVLTGAEDAVSDAWWAAIGLRRVAMKRHIFTINGERLFLKGGTTEPPRVDLANATSEEIERDVAVAREAGLDLLRVRGHVSRPELYDAADRLGVMLWQDFPLSGPYGHGMRRQAAGQAGRAVDLLGHRPSIVCWCGHDEPATAERGAVLVQIASQQRPTWTKAVLDSSVRRTFERADSTRPAIAHAEALPDCDLAALAARLPRLVELPVGVRHARDLETLRRLKYRPTGGYCGAAGPTTSASAPVIVVADEPEPVYRAGQDIDLAVHVVSDLRAPLSAARVEARVIWPSSVERWSWEGEVDADSCSLVGRIRARVPDDPGPFQIELDLVHDGAKAANRYLSEVKGGSATK